MSKLKIAPRGCKQLQPSIVFQNLADSTCKHLTVPLYNFVAERQKVCFLFLLCLLTRCAVLTVKLQEQGNSNTKGMTSKIKRENKYIPELIYQIEDYERYLIQLGKATKLNLLRNAKRSTTRDFKILVPAETESEHSPDTEPGIMDSATHETESCEAASVEIQEADGDNVACPELNSPSLTSDSALDDCHEDGNSHPRFKRPRTNKVVQDSDEDECI